MGSYLYDDALLAKLNNWTKNTEVAVFLQDEFRQVVERVADEHNDSPIKLPMIVISRSPSGYGVIDHARNPRTGDGITLNANSKKVEILNSIPIDIRYRIDVYTRHYRECDDYIRNLVFNIINYPKLVVDIPYNSIHREHISNIRLISDVEDTSDRVPNSMGQVSRLSVGISIDDAYLWDARVRDTVSIGIGSNLIIDDTIVEKLKLND